MLIEKESGWTGRLFLFWYCNEVQSTNCWSSDLLFSGFWATPVKNSYHDTERQHTEVHLFDMLGPVPLILVSFKYYYWIYIFWRIWV